MATPPTLYARPHFNRRRSCCSCCAEFVLGLQRSSAPLAYDRFMELLDSEFFDDMLVYRTEPGLRATHLAPAAPSSPQRASSESFELFTLGVPHEITMSTTLNN